MSNPTSRGLTVWLTGLSGSGKTTSARSLYSHLEHTDQFVVLLDGDALRTGINKDLGFSGEDRDESVRRAGEIALLLAQQGAIVVVSLVSPRRIARDAVRARHENAAVPFLEVHVAASLEVCEQRDPKDLYRRTRAGLVSQMTGVHDPYEEPLTPELVLATGDLSVSETGILLAEAVLAILEQNRLR